MKSNRFTKIFSMVVSLGIAIASLMPLIWMAISTFKNKNEVFALPVKIFPETWTLENYKLIFQDIKPGFFSSMMITFAVAASAVVLSLTVNMMAAYSFARLEFRLKKLLWVICILTMYIPGITILITSFLVVNALGMLNTFWVLLLPGVASGGTIFFFRQFFLNMPISLEEAALIDGCSRYGIFFRIFIPMSTSPMVILGAGCFIGYWNSFIWPVMTVSDTSLMQVMQVIRSFNSFYANNYGAVLAASTVGAIPPIILFFIFQKQIVKGLVLSGLK